MVVHILRHQEEMLDYNKDISMKRRYRKILINNLIMQAFVGVYENEKQKKQRIIVERVRVQENY